jgi:hypothetical protein
MEARGGIFNCLKTGLLGGSLKWGRSSVIAFVLFLKKITSLHFLLLNILL